MPSEEEFVMNQALFPRLKGIRTGCLMRQAVKIKKTILRDKGKFSLPKCTGMNELLMDHEWTSGEKSLFAERGRARLFHEEWAKNISDFPYSGHTLKITSN